MGGYLISMYCFNSLLRSGDLTKKAAMRYAASAGFDGIEMLDMFWDAGAPRDEQAEKLLADAADEFVTVSCYTVHNDLGLFDEAEWRAEVDRLLAELETGKRLGVSLMRVESTKGPKPPHEEKSFEECLEPVARGLKLAAKRAAELSITLGLENHGRYVGTSERVMQVIDAVGEANFGACIDIGNFLVVDEDPVAAVTRLAPKAVHVHVKDMHFYTGKPASGGFATNAGNFLTGAVLGEGDVDVTRCLDTVLKAGYRGCLSLEFEGPENVFFAVRRANENLREAVSRLPLK